MCGIAGFYGLEDKELIKQFSVDLAHRGPDGEGFYLDRDVSLLNRRLAIIDLATGDQPIYNEDKSLVVVYNGEIYNYRELREELERAGHTFTTASDTEVIVHGYEEWGDNSFDRLNGMFGIALYDKKKKKLLLVRDHFGIKPLYYFLNKKQLYFSSEIKPLLKIKSLKVQPNDRILYRYLRFRVHDDSEQTFFKGIAKLMPGEMMIVDSKGISKKNYTNLREELLKDTLQAGAYKNGNHDKDEFLKRLTDSVRLRLISEVPVGTCLSGGLDSSTVVALVNKLLSEKVKESESVGKIQRTFSAVFPHSVNDEERYIDDLLSKVKNVSSNKVKPKAEEFFDDLDDFVRTQEEPTISTGPYAQYKVMQTASEHVKVVLDGQGADEMMAGYDPYYLVYWRQLMKEGRSIELLKEVFSSLDIIQKNLGKYNGVDATTLLRGPFRDEHQFETFVYTKDNLKQRLLEDVFTNSLPSLLRYEDKNSMRYSIEGRVPFLDLNLIRFIFSLPDSEIIKSGWNKAILRNSIESLLPESIAKRRNKIGFTTPEKEWFLRMKNRIYEVFMSESFGSRPYFDQRAVLSAFQNFLDGKNDDTLLFWRLLNVEKWLRIFIDKKLAVKKKQKPLAIAVEKEEYERHLIQTEKFEKGDDYVRKISDYTIKNKKVVEKGKKWFVVVSEKIIAISQGRSYFIWDIHPGWWAKFLSKHVKRTPYGIGLGMPETMQLAIQEAGLGKVIWAATVSVLSKAVGFDGNFYRIAGREVAAIDGPTEYSVYPSNVSAKLAPKDPEAVAKKIQEQLNDSIKDKNFLGVVIIDANDLGQNILGNSTPLDSRLIEKTFSDNPMGQGREQTPIALIVTPK